MAQVSWGNVYAWCFWRDGIILLRLDYKKKIYSNDRGSCREKCLVSRSRLENLDLTKKNENLRHEKYSLKRNFGKIQRN